MIIRKGHEVEDIRAWVQNEFDIFMSRNVYEAYERGRIDSYNKLLGELEVATKFEVSQ